MNARQEQANSGHERPEPSLAVIQDHSCGNIDAAKSNPVASAPAPATTVDKAGPLRTKRGRQRASGARAARELRLGDVRAPTVASDARAMRARRPNGARTAPEWRLGGYRAAPKLFANDARAAPQTRKRRSRAARPNLQRIQLGLRAWWPRPDRPKRLPTRVLELPITIPRPTLLCKTRHAAQAGADHSAGPRFRTSTPWETFCSSRPPTAPSARPDRWAGRHLRAKQLWKRGWMSGGALATLSDGDEGPAGKPAGWVAGGRGGGG